MKYDVVVIGSGPAGLTAGIYAARAGLKVVVIEGPQPGGQLMTTTKVENWPGEVSIDGPELMIKMREQAAHCGAEFMSESVTSVDFSKRPFSITTESSKNLSARAVLVATGAKSKRLGCPGEDAYWAKGVSTCATCDGPFFRGKDIVIVGGGNTAMTEAEHMSHIASSVTIVHILDQLTSNDPIKDKVVASPNVSILYNSTVTEITGNEHHVTGVTITNQKNGQVIKKDVHGVFIAIGFNPNTGLFKGQLAMDQYGYLTVHDHTKTSVEGVFAAGDVSDYRYRQAVTSAGVGCMAALDIQSFLSKNA